LDVGGNVEDSAVLGKFGDGGLNEAFGPGQWQLGRVEAQAQEVLLGVFGVAV
jgi:hypothetical protein